MSKEKISNKKIAWVPKFTTRNLAVLGILTAVSFVFYMFLKFPLPFMFPSWLDMQFSDLPALLASFALGPVGGVIVIVLKCLIKMPFSSTQCVGELADIIVGTANVFTAGVFYQYHKSKKGAVIALLIGTGVSTLVSLMANAFILIPFYKNAYGWGAIIGMAKAIFPDVSEGNFYLYYLPLSVLPFNILRCAVCGVLTYFVYKPLSKALHWEENSNNKKTEIKILENGLKEYLSKSEEETFNIAKEYAKTLSKGDVVLLSGDLGAGKTAFTKGVASYFGLSGVTSPTYTYLNVYGDYLYHYDCYRLSCGEDAEMLGLTEYFNGDNICIVEWAENIMDVIPKDVKRVEIKKVNENTRKIIL